MTVLTRILLLDSTDPVVGARLRELPGCEVRSVASWSEAVADLRQQTSTAFVGDPSTVLAQLANHPEQSAEQILTRLRSGVALLDSQMRVTWANPTFLDWCGQDPLGKSFEQALQGVEVLTTTSGSWADAGTGQSVSALLHQPPHRYLDAQITPCGDENSPEPAADQRQLIVLVRDVTGEVVRQQKLDALYLAGCDLAALDTETVAELDLESRIELLKQNLRRYVRDLLHYDVIEIRLLNPPSNELVLLLEEGMTEEAVQRRLFTGVTDNGVTGHVAATGKSYVCPDTAADPLYLLGASQARSSLTVPLLYRDQVVGTFNVENPNLNAFSAADLQFTELFAREIAQALHTLDLLTAQSNLTATRSIDAINREVSLPVDEVLNLTSDLLSRAAADDAETRHQLQRILDNARAIKRSISQVSDSLAPAPRRQTAKGCDTATLRGQRLLLVDNDERTRLSAHAILDRFGCLVETAATAQQALALAQTTAYDAILADIRLPDLGGYDTYRRLKELQPHSRLILMTVFGYDAAHSIVKARQDGLRFVLFKPFRLEQVLDALLAPIPKNPSTEMASVL